MRCLANRRASSRLLRVLIIVPLVASLTEAVPLTITKANFGRQQSQVDNARKLKTPPPPIDLPDVEVLKQQPANRPQAPPAIPSTVRSRRKTVERAAAPSAPAESGLHHHASKPVNVFRPSNVMLPQSGASSAERAMARLDPFNQSGDQIRSLDSEWSLPLVQLPGRGGMDLGLTISYSSLVWTRVGNSIYFDEDIGAPSPGFRLGFPSISDSFFDSSANVNARLMTTSAGRRVELRQVNASTFESADSSYLQLVDNGDNTLTLKSMDGTQMRFWHYANGWQAKEIKDRNGNYLTIENNSDGDLQTITDTLGRILHFNYDGNANLNEITQSWNGATHQWATFGWQTKTFAPNFSGLSVFGSYQNIPVLTQVGLPDSSRYAFEYNSAGQINMIRRYGDSIGPERSHTAYDYDGSVSDCPRLTQQRVWAENWSGIWGLPYEVPTSFAINSDGSHQLTDANGTLFKEFYGTGWQKGLVTRNEVWSGGAQQKWIDSVWTQDNTAVNYQTNPRVFLNDIHDSAGNLRRTVVAYYNFTMPDGALCSLPHDVLEYQANATTIARHVYTQYNWDSAYINRHIIGLPLAEFAYEGDNTLAGKTTYVYDWAGEFLQGLPAAPVQHDASYSTSVVTGRGNLVAVQRWDVTDQNNSAKVLEARTGYNIDGSVIFSRDELGHQTSIDYTDSFSDSTNRNSYAYPTTVKDADWNVSTAPNNYSTVQYNYDYGRETRMQGPPPAGQSQGLIQTFAYDNALRPDRVTTVNTGAYVRYAYGPNYTQRFASINSVADESYEIDVVTGLGQLVDRVRNHPGSSGGYSTQLFYYDAFSRPMIEYNAREMNSSWQTSGTDDDGWHYSQQTYDWKGRPLVTTHQDGTQKYASYSGCGCAGGEVVTLTDEVGRQQRVYADVLGRQWKTEVLNWNGSVYSTTTNTLNTSDQVTLSRVTDNATGTYQDTAMTYDGYGRLQSKHVPEQNAGTATTYAYNNDGAIASITDARGATENFSYNGRHLPVQISYSAPSGIPTTPTVSFGFDAAGNRISMTDGLGTVGYGYDQLSRMIFENRYFNQLNRSYEIDYGYNLANELTTVATPAWSKQVGYSYDSEGRLISVTGSGFVTGYYSGTSPNLTWNQQAVTTFASGITRRASGAVKQMALGNGLQQSLVYNSRWQATQNQLTNFAQTITVGANYQYYADGKVKSAYRTDNNSLDRSYSYDQAGRIAGALTGNESHGGNVADGPYKESFSYDVWGNTTSLSKRLWTATTNIDGGSFSNNRRQYWGYDASGFVTSSASVESAGYSYQYDAAGKRTRLSPQLDPVYGQPAVQIDTAYDGNGLAANQTDTRRYADPNTAQPYSTVTTGYYLHSSALGGEVIAEIDSQGNRTASYVYMNGMQLAKDQAGGWPSGALVTWQYSDPVTGTTGTTNIQRDYLGTTELDALGADVSAPPPVVIDQSNFAQPVFSDVFKGTYFEIEGGPSGDHSVDKRYLNMVNKDFDAWNAQRFYNHGFKDVAQEIVANNPNVGIMVSGKGASMLAELAGGSKMNSDGSFTFWGAKAANALGLESMVEGMFSAQNERADLPGYIKDFYKTHQGTIDRCVNKVFGQKADGTSDIAATVMPRQTVANAPELDHTWMTQFQMQGHTLMKDTLGMPGLDGNLGHGTVYIASDLYPGISKEVATRAFFHELGNILSGTIVKYPDGSPNYKAFGDPAGIGNGDFKDDDTGARLEFCMFKSVLF